MLENSGLKSSMVNSPQKAGPAQSPWKKPKGVTLLRAKSLKRKSDMFNVSGANNSPADHRSSHLNDDMPEQSPKNRKTVFNRFSVHNNMNNSSNLSYNFNSPSNNSIAADV